MDTPSQPLDTVVPEDTSLLAFYRDMNLGERRTFWACFAGWALDGMDFMIYPLVIGTIISLWQVERSIAGLALTVTLLSSSIGGWLAGYFADRIGRVRTLQITILWFSFLACFAPSHRISANSSPVGHFLDWDLVESGRRALC